MLIPILIVSLYFIVFLVWLFRLYLAFISLSFFLPSFSCFILPVHLLSYFPSFFFLILVKSFPFHTLLNFSPFLAPCIPIPFLFSFFFLANFFSFSFCFLFFSLCFFLLYLFSNFSHTFIPSISYLSLASCFVPHYLLLLSPFSFPFLTFHSLSFPFT